MLSKEVILTVGLEFSQRTRKFILKLEVGLPHLVLESADVARLLDDSLLLLSLALLFFLLVSLLDIRLSHLGLLLVLRDDVGDRLPLALKFLLRSGLLLDHQIGASEQLLVPLSLG